MPVDFAALEEAEFFFHTCIISDKSVSSTRGPLGHKDVLHDDRLSTQVCRKEVLTVREIEAIRAVEKFVVNAQFRIYFPSTTSIELGDKIKQLSGEPVGDEFSIIYIPEVSTHDSEASTKFGYLTGFVNHIEVVVERTTKL